MRALLPILMAALSGCASGPVPPAASPAESAAAQRRTSDTGTAEAPTAEPPADAADEPAPPERGPAPCVPERAAYACPSASDPAACAIETYTAGRALHERDAHAEAFVTFDAALEADPAGEAAGFAATLALDALNRRMRELDRPNDCPEQMHAALARYRAALCTGAVQGWETECEQLDRLACVIGARSALALADSEPAAASRRYEGLANDPRCAETQAEHLYNAAVSAEQAGNTGRATGLRERLAREHPGAFEPAPEPAHERVPIVE